MSILSKFYILEPCMYTFTIPKRNGRCASQVTCTSKDKGYSRVECKRDSNEIPAMRFPKDALPPPAATNTIPMQQGSNTEMSEPSK